MITKDARNSAPTMLGRGARAHRNTHRHLVRTFATTREVVPPRPRRLELLPTPTASSQAYAAAAKLTVERKMPVEQKLAQMEQEGEFAKLAGAGKPFEQVLPPYI